MSDNFVYEIGGKTFVQRPLVLGQIEQIAPILLKLVGGLSPKAVESAAKIVDKTAERDEAENLDFFLEIAQFLFLQKKLSEALSFILVEEGTELGDDRDVGMVERHLRWHVTVSIGAKVVQDFFSCNDLSSLGELVSMFGGPSPTPQTEQTQTTA